MQMCAFFALHIVAAAVAGAVVAVAAAAAAATNWVYHSNRTSPAYLGALSFVRFAAVLQKANAKSSHTEYTLSTFLRAVVSRSSERPRTTNSAKLVLSRRLYSRISLFSVVPVH